MVYIYIYTYIDVYILDIYIHIYIYIVQQTCLTRDTIAWGSACHCASEVQQLS